MQIIQVESYREIRDSQQGHQAVNTECGGCAVLGAITRQRLFKTPQTEKEMHAVVNI